LGLDGINGIRQAFASLHFPEPIGALMADNPDPRPAQVPIIPVSDSPHAPFIFYEWAPAFGFTNGIVNLSLAANRSHIGKDGAALNEQVVVAHLRGNVQAALSLRDSVNKALLLAAPTPEGKTN